MYIVCTTYTREGGGGYVICVLCYEIENGYEKLINKMYYIDKTTATTTTTTKKKNEGKKNLHKKNREEKKEQKKKRVRPLLILTYIITWIVQL